jgi:hypothetical protein
MFSGGDDGLIDKVQKIFNGKLSQSAKPDEDGICGEAHQGDDFKNKGSD